MIKRWHILLGLLALAVLVLLGVFFFKGFDSREQTKVALSERTGKKKEPPVYVGGQSCAQCHKQEYEQWSGSHHDLAMQEATSDTVLGDFEKALASENDEEARKHLEKGIAKLGRKPPKKP